MEYLRKLEESKSHEAKVMKGVEGWIVGESPYHSKRWMPPVQRKDLGYTI